MVATETIEVEIVGMGDVEEGVTVVEDEVDIIETIGMTSRNGVEQGEVDIADEDREVRERSRKLCGGFCSSTWFASRADVMCG